MKTTSQEQAASSGRRKRHARTSSAGPGQTRALGRRLGGLLGGGDVICLYGELGSGKTTFTQGLARGAGFRGKVTSPTFVLARTYHGPRWRVNHLDLYRLAEGGDAGDVGIEEFLSDPQGICVLEWPEAGLDYYPPDRLEIRFSHGARGERILRFRALGKRSRAIMRALAGRKKQ